MPRYELRGGTSSKFWHVELKGSSVTTTYGRIGTSGQQTRKSFSSPAEAQREYDKLVREKARKGYRLVGGGSSSRGASHPGATTAASFDAIGFLKPFFNRWCSANHWGLTKRKLAVYVFDAVSKKHKLDAGALVESYTMEDTFDELGKKVADFTPFAVIICWDREPKPGARAPNPFEHIYDDAQISSSLFYDRQTGLVYENDNGSITGYGPSSKARRLDQIGLSA